MATTALLEFATLGPRAHGAGDVPTFAAVHRLLAMYGRSPVDDIKSYSADALVLQLLPAALRAAVATDDALPAVEDVWHFQ